jgi:D-beta-D-heptose 7-phosphate kinase/D-beta-D-heptose 1-phosphate adenosyltransferase
VSLKRLIERWQGKTVFVFGDPMYDVYHWGRVDRVSPEAPVPVLVEEAVETRPGGAYNVAQNLAMLGCRVTRKFPPEPWTVKRRFMCGRHQLLRVDKDAEAVCRSLSVEECGRFDAMVVSDYGKGWVDAGACYVLEQAARDNAAPVVVDPKDPDWRKYRFASVICPNRKEWEAALYVPDCAILEKRGEEGINIRTGGILGHVETVPAVARHVYDVTGAGDTVVAVVAASLAAGGDLRSAASLAVLAAGHVVGEVGTTAIDAATLSRLVDEGGAR